MRRAPTIKLDIPVRKELERLSRSRSVAVRLAERSRIVLLAAGGLDNQEIAAKLDITRQKAGRWRDRSLKMASGESKRTFPQWTDSLDRPPEAGPDREEDRSKGSLRTPHWSRSLMARATGVSESTVGRIWRAHGLKPHPRTFKLSRQTEDVVDTAEPSGNAIVLSRKSQMQALDRTQPGLPLKKGPVSAPSPTLSNATGRPMFIPRSIRWTARLSGPVCRSIVGMLSDFLNPLPLSATSLCDNPPRVVPVEESTAIKLDVRNFPALL